MSDKILSNQQKKLLFRAWHRGTREADLVLGRFAQVHVPLMDQAQLDLFADLLNEQDPDIYDWLTGQKDVPEPFRSLVIDSMQNFYQTNNQATSQTDNAA
jgi:antitoxin CptB